LQGPKLQLGCINPALPYPCGAGPILPIFFGTVTYVTIVYSNQILQSDRTSEGLRGRNFCDLTCWYRWPRRTQMCDLFVAANLNCVRSAVYPVTYPSFAAQTVRRPRKKCNITTV